MVSGETYRGMPDAIWRRQFSCSNPTCGPYMEGACKRSKQNVARREVDLDTLSEERKLEVERQTKLREIYKRRKDVSITVEEAPAATPAPAPSDSAPKR